AMELASTHRVTGGHESPGHQVPDVLLPLDNPDRQSRVRGQQLGESVEDRLDALEPPQRFSRGILARAPLAAVLGILEPHDLEDDLAAGIAVLIDAVDRPPPLATPGRRRIGWSVLFSARAGASGLMDVAAGTGIVAGLPSVFLPGTEDRLPVARDV